jgi:hypothetical protein
MKTVIESADIIENVNMKKNRANNNKSSVRIK